LRLRAATPDGIIRGMRRGGLCCIAALLCLATSSAAADDGGWQQIHVRTLTIHYKTQDGQLRAAYVVLPDWYGPRNNPPVPLIISPHGRGVPATENVDRWGDLPALGSFAVVNPEGQGRRFARFSWGYPGQIEDLARMPEILNRSLPWLRIDRSRVYAFGASMGGQESLLLVARHPGLLAGVAAFDAVTDMASDTATSRISTAIADASRAGAPSSATGCARSRVRRSEAHRTARRVRMRAAARFPTRARSPAPACRSSSGGAEGTASSIPGTSQCRSCARSGACVRVRRCRRSSGHGPTPPTCTSTPC